MGTEETKKSKKEVSALAISIIALTTSIFFSIYSIIDKNISDEKSETAKKIERVNQLTNELILVNQKRLKLPSEAPNSDLNQLSTMLNWERIVIVEKIIKLIEDKTIDFNPLSYTTIAAHNLENGDFEKAKKYNMKALKLTENNLTKIILCRNLGQLFNIPSTDFYDKDSVMFYRNKSVKLSEQLSGEARLYNRGFSFQSWALDELYRGDKKTYTTLLDSAKLDYLKLPDLHPLKKYLLNSLNNIETYNKSTRDFELIRSLVGKWKLKISEKNVLGNGFVNTTGGNTFIDLEMYHAGKLVESYKGQLISIHNNFLTFNLLGVKRELDLQQNMVEKS